MINQLVNNQHFKYGFPFLIAVVGGSFGLQFFAQVRYDVQKNRKITTKTKEILALSETKPITLEQAYDEYKQTVDIDNWQNVRGPRPWEEGGDKNEDFRKLIEKRAEESKKGWIFSK